MDYQIRARGFIDRFQCPASGCEEIVDIPDFGPEDRIDGSGRFIRRKLNLTCACGQEIKLFLQCENE